MGGPAAVLEGVESVVGRFLFTPLPPPLSLFPAPPTFDFTTKSDWSVRLATEVIEVVESDWSAAFNAAAVAILALAAALGDGAEDAFDVSLRKNKLPEGRSLVSSFRVKRPSLGGVVEDVEAELEDEVVSVEAGSSLVGGEWSLMKDSPYFSF